MAWTWQTAVFFAGIGLLLAGMSVWEWRSPGGAPRRGIFGIRTTRGDRLFISLLATAYLHLIWLAAVGPPLWGASLISAVVAIVVFRKV
jgi:predicted small integral membrane protein